VAEIFLSAVEYVDDDIRQMETKTADLLVLEAEIAIECSKVVKCQVLIEFWQNLFKEKAKHSGLL
jgi:hypothetical protein